MRNKLIDCLGIGAKLVGINIPAVVRRETELVKERARRDVFRAKTNVLSEEDSHRLSVLGSRGKGGKFKDIDEKDLQVVVDSVARLQGIENSGVRVDNPAQTYLVGRVKVCRYEGRILVAGDNDLPHTVEITHTIQRRLGQAGLVVRGND